MPDYSSSDGPGVRHGQADLRSPAISRRRRGGGNRGRSGGGRRLHDGELGGPAQTFTGAVPWREGAADAPLAQRNRFHLLHRGRARLHRGGGRPADPKRPGRTWRRSKRASRYFSIDSWPGRSDRGDHYYLGGPWPKGTPEQGYQSRFSPAQLYRAAIPAVERYVGANFKGASFAELAAADQDTVLKGLESGDVQLDGGVDSKTFFAMLLQNTKEGYFSDPIYGGNKDMAAWKMIGFPGRPLRLQRVGGPARRAVPVSRRWASRAAPAGRRAEAWPPLLNPSMRCWWASAGPARSWASSCVMPGSACVALERGAWRDTPTDFATDLRAGRAALHVAPPPVSESHLRHPDHPQQHEPGGAADAPSGLVPAGHRRRQRRRALERPDLALPADRFPDQQPQPAALRQGRRSPTTT